MASVYLVADARRKEDRMMFGTEPWGYGDYGQFHMIVWIILAVASAAGIVWRWRA